MRIRSAVCCLGLGLMGLMAGLVSNPTAATGESQAPEGSRLFELRTYTAAPGKLEALHARFRDHTLRLFEKHGMKNVVYLSPTDEQHAGNTLVYLISHASREAADKSWAAFRADPEWQKVRSESEKDGKLVEKVDSQYLTPTDYSPLKK